MEEIGQDNLLAHRSGEYTVTMGSNSTKEESIFDIPVPGDSSMFGSFQILLNTAIGSGTLMVPYAYTAGIGMELVISAAFCFIAYMALYFLIEASQYSNSYDYTGIFKSCFGEKPLWILNLMIFLVQFGTVTIYCLWNGRLLNHLVGSSHPLIGSTAFWSFLASTFCVFPLTLFRSIAKLENFASISTFFICLLIIHAFYWLIKDVNDGYFDKTAPTAFNFNKYEVIISALSVNCMAFNCHLNLFSCLEHMNNCTLRRAHKLCGITVLVSFALYNLFGLFSYLDLRDKIGPGSSLEFYERPNWFTKLTIVGVVIVLIVSSPLVVWTARRGFNNLIWKDKPMTPLRWVCLGGGLVLLASLLASSSEDVIFFFDIVGGAFTPTIEFVFPAIFFLKIQRGAPKWKIILAGLVLVFSIISIAACLIQAVKQIIDAIRGHPE